MEEKSSADPIQQNLDQESNKEIEELSGDASAPVIENMDSTSIATADEISEPSTQSEQTSGIEMVSRSTTSASEIQCQGVATSGAEKKLQPSASETTSGMESISRSTTAASEITSDGVETSNAEKSECLPSELTVDLGTKSTPASDVLSEGTVTKLVEKDSNTSASPKKRSFVKKLGSLFSPPKPKTSRSKSMSPKKAQPTDSDISKQVTEEARDSSGGACSKKESEGYFRQAYRKLNISWKPFKHGSGPSSENTNLISNEETDRTEKPKFSEKPKSSKLDKLPPVKGSDKNTCPRVDDVSSLECPHWTDNRSSLSDMPTFDGTSMTDVPSTCSAAEGFSSDIVDNTSEEAVAGSLVSSPDEDVLDRKKDKDWECENKEDPSTEKEIQDVIEPEKSTAEDDPGITTVANENIEESQSTVQDYSAVEETTEVAPKNLPTAKHSK